MPKATSTTQGTKPATARAGVTRAGSTVVWGSTGTNMDSSIGAKQVGEYVKYLKSTNQYVKANPEHINIKPQRCRLYQEWRDSTPRKPDEEPDICEWVVKIDPGMHWGEWSAHLTWERWCRYVSPDGDVETAFAKLRSLARGEYRLQTIAVPFTKTKYNHGPGNCLMFTTESAARAVMAAFSDVIGEEVLEG